MDSWRCETSLSRILVVVVVALVTLLLRACAARTVRRERQRGRRAEREAQPVRRGEARRGARLGRLRDTCRRPAGVVRMAKRVDPLIRKEHSMVDGMIRGLQFQSFMECLPAFISFA